MNCLPAETRIVLEKRNILMDIAVLDIDLGKTVCSLAGLDDEGAVVFRKRIQRFRLLDFIAELPPCIVDM